MYYALSISAPSFHMHEKQIERCAQLLLDIRLRIKRFLKNT